MATLLHRIVLLAAIGVNDVAKVEMRPAYEWTCEECGRNSFESAMVAEWSPEERVEQARHMGLIGEFESVIPEELAGDFVTHPDEVTCKYCGATFETVHPHDEQEE